MREMGAPQQRIDQEMARYIPDDNFEVLEENWDALIWFLEVDDLLRWHNKVCLGLDLLAIQAEVQMHERQFSHQQFGQVRVLGQVAAHELNKKVKK
ncbi:hypothetical protein [Neptunicella sp. SCSIO 80796]|uniref:hypothetical protein n=1 Tax=Neptunicella plasticusilytica TaxID=3117012 RepID=UPI003A4D8307